MKPSKKSKNLESKKPKDFLFWAFIIGGSVLLLVVLIFVFVRPDTSSSKSLPKEISVNEAYQRYQTGTVLVDVREKEEWNEYHIPNTIHIPLGDLERRLKELPIDTPVVVVCRSGNRSQTGRDLLLDAGFTQVTSMAGGIKDWKSAGYPTSPGE